MFRAKRVISLFAVAVGVAIMVSMMASVAFSADRILTLRECIEIALVNNPDMGMARQSLKKSESYVLNSYGNLLPNLQLDFYAGHRYYGPSSVLIDGSGRPVQSQGFDYEDYTFRIASDIVIWDGGANYARLRQSKRNREGAEEELQYNYDMISATVIRAYYNLVRFKKLTVVAEESVNQAKQSLDRTDALLEVGSGTRADVLKAKVLHSNTRLDLIRATNQIEIAKEDLIAVLNLEDYSEVSIDTSLVMNMSNPDPHSEIDFAMDNRSDLRGLRAYLEGADAGVRVAKSGWLPVFGANFGYYWSDREMADNLNFFREEYSWNITAYMRINVFDRFNTSANVKTAKADYRISEYQLEKSRINAVREIKSLIIVIGEAIERVAVASETVEQASEDVRLAEERYRVGAGTMLDTIAAQVSLTQAKADVIGAKCDYLVAIADLDRATGRESRLRAGSEGE
ncbi:MAG: TolC family protein [Candidatus Krumholzibacteria bacterium]|nr:TolC family protein [Candidatus Krumholzibacteria bacterium]